MKSLSYRVLALCAVGLMLATLGLAPAQAAVLLPGTGPVAPDTFMSPTGAVLAALGPTAFVTPGGQRGTLLTAVVEKTPGGTLDFVYQWTANAGNTDNFVATSAISYGTFATDVGYIDPAAILSADLITAGFTVPNGATIAIPNTVQRSLSGNTVDWFFVGLNFEPGDITPILMVETDALSFTDGVAGIQNGATANVPAFSPCAVPEPISLVIWLGIGGLAALSLWRGRRKN